MSRNIVKQMFMILPQEEEKRVIDSNKRIQERLKLLNAARGGTEGFVSGLAAEVIAVSEEDAEGGNVIKASEDANAILEQAREEAQGILAKAQSEAMQIHVEAVHAAEVEKNQVISQAKQQGYKDGQAQAQAQAEQVRREYEQKARELEKEYQQQLDQLEPQFVDTITDIYEHIFQVDLGSYRETVAHLISAAMRNLEGGRYFIIHVSKEDYSYVNMQKKQILNGAVSGNCSVDVVEDITLAKNECMIETESGIFDCGLGTQLEELKKKLMLLAWSKED